MTTIGLGPERREATVRPSLGVAARRLVASAALAAATVASDGPGAHAGPPPTDPPPSSEAGPLVSRARFLMGTTLSIDASGEDAAPAIEAAFDEVDRLDRVLSNWHDSELVRLNERAASAAVASSADLYRAVSAALDWARDTDGAFDPTVEPLVRRLGLRGAEGRLPAPAETDPPAGGAPDGNDLRPGVLLGSGPIEATVGWRHVHLDPAAQSVRFDAPGVGLDLGGIGKGMALDAASSVLRSRGVRSALLNFGGQVLAFGPGPDDGRWRVGLADPSDRERSVEIVCLRDASLATSGQRERSRRTGGVPVGHILDPRSGAPAPFEGTVSVLAGTATTADALDTALFVMGPERGRRWAEAHGLNTVFLVRHAGGRLIRRGTGSLLDAETQGASRESARRLLSCR